MSSFAVSRLLSVAENASAAGIIAILDTRATAKTPRSFQENLING